MLCRNSSRGEGGDEDDEDGEEVNRWNLRKCSAAGLDVLSTVFGDELLPIVLPIVEQKLRVCFLPGSLSFMFLSSLIMRQLDVCDRALSVSNAVQVLHRLRCIAEMAVDIRDN